MFLFFKYFFIIFFHSYLPDDVAEKTEKEFKEHDGLNGSLHLQAQREVQISLDHSFIDPWKAKYLEYAG